VASGGKPTQLNQKARARGAVKKGGGFSRYIMKLTERPPARKYNRKKSLEEKKEIEPQKKKLL